VASTDALLHLGDVALDIPPGELAAAVADLPGQVLVVRGNWDTDRSLEALKDAGWTLSHYLLWTEYRGWLLQFTHEPLSPDELADYDGGFRGALSVHGHVHNAAPVSDRHLNVSLEPMGYRPVLLKELVDKRIDELEA
jgi:calcineurin-like phosphoesterase family protein